MTRVILGDIAISQTGPFGSQLHEEDYVSEGTPIVTVEHLGDTNFTHQNLPFISEADTKRLSKYILIEGDIVFSRVGSIDRNVYVDKNHEGWMFSGRCIRVRADKNKVNPRYLSYYFKQNSFKKMMMNLAVGATMPSLNTKIMNSIELDLLPRESQDKIANILSAIDDKIQINNQINQELEAMAKTLYDYWFVQFDFPDQNGNPYKSSGGKMVYSPELKREIPEGWGVESVGNLLDKVTKAEKIENNSIEFIGKIPVIDQSQKYIAGFTNNENGLIQPQKGHVIFGDHTRVVKYINFDYARGADGTQVLISKNEHISNVLLYHMIKDFDLSNYGYARHFKFLKEKIVIVPDKEVSSKFETQANVIYEKIKNNIFENQELTQLRDWLLPMLMNGQVKVE